MKLLWVKTDFLHPTNRGGQIRTLEMIRRLHKKHCVHYICFDEQGTDEGARRANEYSSAHFTVPHEIVEKSKTSPAFLSQLVKGLVSSVPVAVSRWASPEMRRKIEELDAREKYDSIVCDFLFPAPNIPELSRSVLFQHNVEAMIWKRRAEQAKGTERVYIRKQAERMERFEAEACRAVKRVIAVSESDAKIMREKYGVAECQAVPTGVDIDYFQPPRDLAAIERKADIVFVGSMDWMPNQDGMKWFLDEVWPLILKKRPQTTLAIVGRQPSDEIKSMAGPQVQVTGTVPEVRSWFWGSAISIVPLRIGGGTRLKIYEAMAAKAPVVSTSIGAEGLEIADGSNIAIADDARAFAERSLALLDSKDARSRMSDTAFEMVATRYSWESVTSQFERLLQ